MSKSKQTTLQFMDGPAFGRRKAAKLPKTPGWVQELKAMRERENQRKRLENR